MKKILALLLILSCAFTLVGCSPSITLTDCDPHTDYQHAYIVVAGIEATDRGTMLIVSWHNDTGYSLGYGLGYDIQYHSGDEWVSVRVTDFAIPEIWCMLDSGESGMQKYNTKYFCTLLPGEYRIVVEFYVSDRPDGTTRGTAYALFYVG